MFQRLLEPLTMGGKTYPTGTGIHVGFRMEVRNPDGSEQTVWTINVDRGGGSYTTVGVASNKPLLPNSTFKVFDGGDNAAADILDPSQLFCFAAGTLIATPAGERAVETLAPGDEVATADGRAVPVRWVGRQTVRRAAASGRLAPVRIAAGALGAGPDLAALPRRDLVVTADHALILGGLAITAAALVDGRGIRRLAAEEMPERATFYHIETEAHDVVLAEGAPAETWVDHAERARFDNYDEYLRLWGADRRIVESPLPRVTSARQLPAALRLKLGLGAVESPPQASAA
ncbi:hypothetical protein GI374_08740 [Paracoccus sp. S-4012]|nr:Hint domain-containing protein [Paracoccus sp. S-4012]MRX50527.1 hypothetical protein [Paracoccus sp. S-4012]